MKRIAFAPFDLVNRSNAYAFRMREILAPFGDVMPFEGIKSFVKRLLRLQWWRYDALFTNWTDSEILDPATHRVSGKRVFKLFVKTAIIRVAVRRMIFVRHNVYPHSTASGEEARATRWIDRYERFFDVVLTHSGAHEASSRRYCPHPLYATVADAPPPFALPDHYFVMFGMLFPYKRIEEVIACFPSDADLVVVGAVGDAAYSARLIARERANVIVRPGFLSEADAQAIIKGSQGLIIAHADADVVVSGSFFYAMSMPVPVFAVRTPFLDWVAPRVGAELLRVADDVPALCGLVRDQGRDPSMRADLRVTQAEFGDQAISRVLDGILAP